ncbi:MAG: voltage-gated potassium channel, partial [Pseudonocardiales bacterium]|nr:voltage-gated potassium channel [Pseudonocardiales bacterium]
EQCSDGFDPPLPLRGSPHEPRRPGRTCRAEPSGGGGLRWHLERRTLTLPAVSEPHASRWERCAEWPLTAAALLFLAAYAWPILEPDLPRGWGAVCRAVSLATWVVFALDYVIRISLASARGRYVIRHLPDLVVVALPIFRPLRLLRLLLLLRVLNRQATASFRGKVAVYVAGAAVVLIGCASLAVLDAERGHAGSNISSFADALWWAATTVTTVGYGDRFPVTGQGRAIAVGLMLGGIALIGVVTATVASWLIDRVRAVEDEALYATRQDIAALAAKIDDLSDRLARLQPGHNDAGPPP